MIFVSTSCMRGRDSRFEKDLRVILNTYAKHGIANVELGAALGFVKDLGIVSRFKKDNDANFIIHNLFPPPKESFMLNIATQDEKQRKNHLDFVKQSLEFCRKLDSNLYSLHFGFRADIDMMEKPLSTPVAHETAFTTAKQSLLGILDYAKQYGINVAVENQPLVLSDMILLSHPEHFFELDREFKQKNFGFLIDIGHLALTPERFDRKKFIEKIQDRIFELHIHAVVDGHDHQPLKDASLLDILPKSVIQKAALTIEINKADINQIISSKNIVEIYSNV